MTSFLDRTEIFLNYYADFPERISMNEEHIRDFHEQFKEVRELNKSYSVKDAERIINLSFKLKELSRKTERYHSLIKRLIDVVKQEINNFEYY